MTKNIVLIGMRAAGKTSLGKWLARKTGRHFIDTDSLIRSQAGKTIQQIVEDDGWSTFRDWETRICQELSTKQGLIIATGGGVVLGSDNIEALRQNGYIIFLNVPLGVLISRIMNSKNAHRPSLTGKPITEELRQIWSERKDLYFNAADLVLPFSGKNYQESLRSAQKAYEQLVNEDVLEEQG